jgi:type VI secretion system protein ImpM
MSASDAGGLGAMPRASASGRVGFFGKLPSRGDFVRRDLPNGFVDAWDAWLQEGIEASRRVLGEGWLDSWLCAPMWRFAVAPGFCGTDAWAGVMMPSVDRAGRYFPLTLAAAAPAGVPAAAMLAGDWIAGLEMAALSALAEESDFEHFAEAVAGLPAFVPPRGDGWAGGWRAQGAAGDPAALGQTLAFATAAALGARCVFATHGGGRVAPAAWVLSQLPSSKSFAGLIDDTASGGVPPPRAPAPAWKTAEPVAPLPVADTELGHAAGLFGSDFATEAPPSLPGEPPGGAFDSLFEGGDAPAVAGPLPGGVFDEPVAAPGQPAAATPTAFDQAIMGDPLPEGAFNEPAAVPHVPMAAAPTAFDQAMAADQPFAPAPEADDWVGESVDDAAPPEEQRLPPAPGAPQTLSPRDLFGDAADDVPATPVGLFDSKDGKGP